MLRSRSIGATVAAALALNLAACDLPVAPPTDDGPRVLRITPDPSDGDVDRLQSFRIELDRRIAPSSAPQGVVALTSGDNYVYVDMQIDVVHPALIVTPFDALDPDVDYQIVVHAMRDLEGNVSGDTEPVVYHTGHSVTPRVPDAITYDDVASSFDGCTRCHGATQPALGLDLSSAAAIRTTALGIAATEVRPSVEGSIGAGVTPTLAGFPRIDPQSPARSYLLYTMLGDVHIAGAPMPPDAALASDEELLRLQRWIQAGAPGL